MKHLVKRIIKITIPWWILGFCTIFFLTESEEDLEFYFSASIFLFLTWATINAISTFSKKKYQNRERIIGWLKSWVMLFLIFISILFILIIIWFNFINHK